MASEKGLNVAVSVVMTLTVLIIAGAIGVYVADKTVTVTTLSSSAGGTYATNTYNFTGNSTEGEYVNITTPGVGSGTMCYYFNTTGIGKPIGCLVVDVRSGANTSTGSAAALKTSIDGDTDMDAYLSVTNTSTTNVVITALNVGSTYNWATTDTVTNGAWATATMTGGTDSSLTEMRTDFLGAGETGAGFIVILVIAFIGSIAIGFMFGLIGRKK